MRSSRRSPRWRTGAATVRAVRVERGDGFERLRAFLPPPERRGLTFIDPPYEEAAGLRAPHGGARRGLQRFPTGVFAAWYPIKDARTTRAWLAGCAETLPGHCW